VAKKNKRQANFSFANNFTYDPSLSGRVVQETFPNGRFN
jgi:hypothetical protein